MRSCNDILKIMSLYIDNELDDKTREEFEEHIKDCGDCCAELNKLKEVVGLLNSFEEVELPADFKKSLHRKLTEEKRNQNGSKSLWIERRKYLGIASSIAALLILAFITGNRLFNKDDDLTNNKSALHISATSAASETIEYNNHELSNKADVYDEKSKSRITSKADDTASPMVGNNGKTRKMDENVQTMFTESIDDGNNSFVSGYEGKISNEVNITIKFSESEEIIQDIKEIANLYGINTESKGQKNSHVEREDDNVEINCIRPSGELIDFFVEGDNVISFNVEASKYNEFINRLKEDYAKSITIVDKSPEMIEIKKELEVRLKDIEKDLKSQKGSEKIERLEGEKGKIQDDIGNINEKEGYRTIIITIEK